MQIVFDSIGNSSVGTFMAQNANAFPYTEAIHMLAISIVVGVIAIVDLRLIGLASTTYRVSRLSTALLPITWAAVAAAVVTGLLLVASKPQAYYDNSFFRIKMVMLALAGLNISTAARPQAARVPAAARRACSQHRHPDRQRRARLGGDRHA